MKEYNNFTISQLKELYKKTLRHHKKIYETLGNTADCQKTFAELQIISAEIEKREGKNK